jgi:putative colanic acid biosynthesis acetyltransferase WcaF
MGDNSWIGTGAELYNIDDIVIGSDVAISQQSYLCTGSHDHRSPTFEFDNGPIVIEDGAWLCARTTVLRGVTIGANSVVGATALVSQDTPPDSIVRPPQSTIGTI